MNEPATDTETKTETAGREDRIRTRAYELYEKRSGAPGDAESDWYRAEAELQDEAAEAPK